jgi:thiamine-phosphate pyrophosphorylase
MLILDKATAGDRDISEIAKMAVDGGAGCIQLRDKISDSGKILSEAIKLRKITERAGCVFIVNDSPRIALDSGADGVHLGQEDTPYADARDKLGRGKLVGISTHDLAQAEAAAASGADYIGVGPIFSTGTKPDAKPIGPDIVAEITRKIAIPAFFIGGIDISKTRLLRKMGARSVAVASAVITDADVSGYTKKLIQGLKD